MIKLLGEAVRLILAHLFTVEPKISFTDEVEVFAILTIPYVALIL